MDDDIHLGRWRGRLSLARKMSLTIGEETVVDRRRCLSLTKGRRSFIGGDRNRPASQRVAMHQSLRQEDRRSTFVNAAVHLGTFIAESITFIHEGGDRREVGWLGMGGGCRGAIEAGVA